MPTTFASIIEHDAAVPTWFGIGGRADALARPRTVEELRDLLLAFAGQPIRVLGDGANLLVDDGGVDGLVVSLGHLQRVEESPDAANAEAGSEPTESGGADATDGDLDRPRWVGERVLLRVEAGANLPKLIVESVRNRLAGLEHLAGIPATVGGAVFMNAGGAFGSVAPVVSRVHTLTYQGASISIPRNQIAFDYRHSGLDHVIITGADLVLTRVSESEHPRLRRRLKEVMEYKKRTQPMAERSAGCVFKNPTTQAGRVSAGMLIDQAGCKGKRVGGAEVSPVHANFIVTHPGCRARDILNLMQLVRERVREKFYVTLEPEIAIWSRERQPFTPA